MRYRMPDRLKQWLERLGFAMEAPERSEMLEHEWTTLRSLWAVARATQPPPPDAAAAAIDHLLDEAAQGGAAARWPRFNDAEQRVGRWLTPAQLRIEYAGLLQMATARALPGVSALPPFQPLFDDDAKRDEQRAAYMVLLHRLQSAFMEGRFQRRLRSEVARRLFYIGLVVLAVAAIAPLLLVWGKLDTTGFVDARALAERRPIALNRFSSEPLFALTLVASFGMLGAFFSRAIAFQSSIATLTFDGVQQLYLGRVLRMRLLYGVIGATIFYFVLRSGLVLGPLFPDLKAIGIGEHPVWRLGPNGPVRLPGGRLEPAGLTVLEPTVDMAKLLVWSFIAGFSERLVPDSLARTEAQATRTEPS